MLLSLSLFSVWIGPYALPEAPRHATYHPSLEYLQFQGTIPQYQYLGGTVIVRDIATYELIQGNYSKGYIRFHKRSLLKVPFNNRREILGEFVSEAPRIRSGYREQRRLHLLQPPMKKESTA